MPILMAAAPVEAEQAMADVEWADEAHYEADRAVADNGYPLRKVLEAFGTACSGVEVTAVTQASAQAAGWDRFEPAPDSAIGQIIASGLRLVAEDDDGDPVEIIDGGVWSKQVAGRDLVLIISGATFSGIASYGCRVYDLAAPAAPTAEQLQEWAVREPQQVFTGLPGAYKFVWNPGLKPGHMEMEASFVPQGTVLPAPLEGIPLSGLVLTASALEFLDQ